MCGTILWFVRFLSKRSPRQTRRHYNALNLSVRFNFKVSLWNSHSVQGASAGSTAMRYYQLHVTGGNIAALTVQAASFNPDDGNRYIPSSAGDRVGDMALAYSAASATLIPAIRYAGRLATHPINTFGQTETTLIEGTGAQNNSTRWGDYSTMTLDPDGCTFWLTAKCYAATSGNWLTRIGSFKHPSCTAITSGAARHGTVSTSPGGAPIVGAILHLGSRTASTNASGFYSFNSMPAGTYHGLYASAPGSVDSGSINNIN